MHNLSGCMAGHPEVQADVQVNLQLSPQTIYKCINAPASPATPRPARRRVLPKRKSSIPAGALWTKGDSWVEAPADCARRVRTKILDNHDPKEGADLWFPSWSEYPRGLENYGRHGRVLGEVVHALLLISPWDHPPPQSNPTTFEAT